MLILCPVHLALWTLLSRCVAASEYVVDVMTLVMRDVAPCCPELLLQLLTGS